MNKVIKRSFDIFASISALIILTPLFFIVALSIKLDSKGTVFFRQERVGIEGRSFRIFKFRTMVSNAQDVGPYYTKLNDARVTNVGLFLRKTSIDELPQLLNVLIGEMSIIGPRPNVPAQNNLYSHKYLTIRNSVKPGITGLAQALVRSNTTFLERQAHDVFYCNKKTDFCFDMWIVYRTIIQVFKTGGY